MERKHVSKMISHIYIILKVLKFNMKKECMKLRFSFKTKKKLEKQFIKDYWMRFKNLKMKLRKVL